MGQHNFPGNNVLYRCAGPNCGALRGVNDRGWLMWTSYGDHAVPVLYLCPWDETIAEEEGTLYVCGESCAQKLQSQFMGNVRQSPLRKSGT
jgi:hypothetical protein